MTSFYIFLVLYVIFFSAGPIAYLKWKAHQRPKEKITERLLRAPGESLLEKINQFDDELLGAYLGWISGPLVSFAVWWLLQSFLPPSAKLGLLLVVAAVFLVWAGFHLRKVKKMVEEYRNNRLGYLGERLVADHLDSLREMGYRIFHDLPRVDGKYCSNIDHVVVGLSGVYAIETKMRRKNDRRINPEAPPNIVKFDGEQLILPYWAGVKPLQQSQYNARWLESHLQKKLNLRVKVLPIVTYPLWSVVGGSQRPDKLQVCNPGQLRGLIPASPIQRLSPDEIHAIVQELDEICRKDGW